VCVRSQTSRERPGEPGISPNEASLPSEPVSLSRRDAHGWARPAKIIWLDDEEAIHRCGSRLLADYLKDYSLVPCFNGDEALRAIARQPPDLLITDYHHPGARFSEMFLRLEERPERFPVLLVSACAGPEHLKRLCSSSTFTIELLGQPSCETLISAILKHLTSANGLPTVT
jgi:CheY-like chemotaxis protein